MIDIILQYIVLPVAGGLLWMFKRQLDHHTDIELLKSQRASDVISHDKDIKQIRHSTDAILNKLDNIESYLRK